MFLCVDLKTKSPALINNLMEQNNANAILMKTTIPKTPFGPTLTLLIFYFVRAYSFYLASC